MKRLIVILALVAAGLLAAGLVWAAVEADRVPTVGGSRAYYNISDEDDMAADSATALTTEQSVKAFVTSGTITMTNKTLTSPVLNTGLSGTAFLDEDAMTSNSATKAASQQSIKAYVDSGAVTMTNKTLTSPTITGPTISGTITGTGVVSATNVADVVRYIQLPLGDFWVMDPGLLLVAAATAPGMEIDDLIPGLVWADAETTPAQVTFRIPDDYASGGAFKVVATESGTSTANQVDFSVYINKSGVAADTAATDQTPVALAGTSSTPSEVTLTPATDFASLTSGTWVTLNIWRDDTATGTNDLEVKGLAFYYTATQ